MGLHSLGGGEPLESFIKESDMDKFLFGKLTLASG